MPDVLQVLTVMSHGACMREPDYAGDRRLSWFLAWAQIPHGKQIGD